MGSIFHIKTEILCLQLQSQPNWRRTHFYGVSNVSYFDFYEADIFLFIDTRQKAKKKVFVIKRMKHMKLSKVIQNEI